jgi:hypothetical protein
MAMLAGACLAASCTRAQVYHEMKDRIHSVDRFQGATQLKTEKGTATVQVDIQNWSIGGGVKLDELPLRSKGMLVVQVRSGRLTTVIGGRREQRGEADFWTVPAGIVMGVETGQDEAVLQIVVIKE